MNQIQLEEDETSRREYVKLLIKALKHCKNYDIKSFEFSEDEKEVIQYHMKHVAVHQKIIGKPSMEEYVAMFVGRIERIIKQNREEVIKVIDLICRQKLILPREDIEELKVLLEYFAGNKVAV